MRWKTLLWLSTVVAVTSSQHAVLENTIENDLHQNPELDSYDDHTESLDDFEVQASTISIEDKTEDAHHEATTTTESHIMTEDVTNDPTIVTGGIEAETVSVREPDYETTDGPGDESLEKTEEIRSSSEELVNVEQDIVETTSGRVRGHQWNENANIISYIDIPYGMYKGRFQPPELPVPTTAIHESLEHDKRCPQLQNDETIGDPDCLTLSIFSPQNVENASVLFHIYDGKFVSGSADPAIYGPEYLVPQGVILVLPNYRLGPLGFLCLQNDTAPGNAALKDLTLALNWTSENIRNFGGDPHNIVVSGDGMSGALAGYLALSPQSKNYINKVIVESGSLLSYWALDRNPISSSLHFLEQLQEHGSIEDVDMKILLTSAQGLEFKPCIENNTDTAFMVDTPWNMVHSQDIDITFMIGSAMYAGIHEALRQSDESIKKINEDYGLLLPDDLKFKDDAERTSIGEKVKTKYFGDNKISLSDIRNLALYFTDAAYLGPGMRSARPLVEAGATVYVYEFSFVGDFNRELESINRPVDGAVRGDIIGYVFTQDGQVPHEDTKEERMVRTLVDLWINFMQNGQPSAENIAWNKLVNTSDSEEEWLSIDTELAMKGIHVERMKLWTDIYNQHFIEHSLAHELSSSVYTVLIAQFVFWIAFFRNVSHLY